jgi:5-methyltetrahydropteroyltriglutamate--homocysteine methyltransferase
MATIASETNARTASTSSARSVARAEPIGSLLRSQAISDGVRRVYGDMTSALRALVLKTRPDQIRALNQLADSEIARLVRRQVDAGLDVVTDGELRRSSFLSSFYDAVEGLGESGRRRVEGIGGSAINYTDPVVLGRVRKVFSPLAEEATFLRAITDFPFKVTLPAPSYFYLKQFVPFADGKYGSRHEFVEDVIAIEKQLLAEAVAAGARWIQLDFPIYPALLDEAYTAKVLEDVGGSFDALLDKAISADARVIADLPADVTTGLHLCRGNFVGGFWSGTIAPLAERIFNELPYDRFLFEWEDPSREGDYSPIKYVPKGPIMALGLISTKTPQLENADEIIRRIEDAGRYLDVSQLAVTPQCGFASLFASNLVQAEDAQWRKLDLVGEVARRVWGS